MKLTSGPGSYFQLHGRLWEQAHAAVLGICVFESADGVAIQDPFNGLGIPVYSVVMEAGLRAVAWIVDGILLALASFAVVVRLDERSVTAHDLPVDLVQVVAEEHDG